MFADGCPVNPRRPPCNHRIRAAQREQVAVHHIYAGVPLALANIEHAARECFFSTGISEAPLHFRPGQAWELCEELSTAIYHCLSQLRGVVRKIEKRR